MLFEIISFNPITTNNVQSKMNCFRFKDRTDGKTIIEISKVYFRRVFISVNVKNYSKNVLFSLQYSYFLSKMCIWGSVGGLSKNYFINVLFCCSFHKTSFWEKNKIITSFNNDNMTWRFTRTKRFTWKWILLLILILLRQTELLSWQCYSNLLSSNTS